MERFIAHVEHINQETFEVIVDKVIPIQAPSYEAAQAWANSLVESAETTGEYDLVFDGEFFDEECDLLSVCVMTVDEFFNFYSDRLTVDINGKDLV